MSAFLRSNLLLSLAYALTGWLALQIAIPPGYAAPLFPPAGIALVALLIHGPRALPFVFLGAMGVQIGTARHIGFDDYSWAVITGPALGAALQAYIGYRLSQRLLRLPDALDSQRSIVRFVALIAPVGCLVCASIAVPLFYWLGIVPISEFAFTWMNWWAGDTLGVLIMVPLLMVFIGQPADDWRSRRLAVSIPMAAALSLLAFTFGQVSQWEGNRLQSQFDRDAEHLASLVQKRLDAQLDQMLALERLATVYPGMRKDAWKAFVTPLMNRYPGTQNFGWSPLITDAERDRFEARQRSAGNPSFAILGRTPAGKTFVADRKAEYLPIIYVEPLASNQSVVGLDPLVLDKTARAAHQTRETRLPAATESIRLVQEKGEQRGVVVYQAVFNPEGRQIGMISGVFRMDDAMNATLAGQHRGNIAVCLIEPLQNGKVQRLYGPTDCESGLQQKQGLNWRAPFSFAGRQWAIQITAMPEYMAAQRSWGAWLTLAFGLLSTSVLGAFLLLTSGRARRVQILVDERTKQLAAASQRLRQQQEELAQAQRIARLGSWENIPGSRELRCSQELLSILRLSSEPQIDEARLNQCIHSEDRVALEHALSEAAAKPSELSFDCRMNEFSPIPRTLHFRIESDVRENGELRVRGTAQDVTEARAAEAHIAYLAHFDQLTGLPNRAHWNERVHAELRAAMRHADTLGVLFLDLDHFKSVNDSLGHAVGDQLLSGVAGRLSGCLRENDFLARLGGDEFVVLLPRLEHREDAAVVARKLLAALREPLLIGEQELSASASIGIAIYPDDGEDVSTLLKHADVAMYGAKDQGRNAYQFFKPEMDVHALERLLLENALRRAIERNELILHYQPQVAAEDGQIIGCEALVRWQHPDLGLLPPVQFISVAENSGLIVDLGEWVLETACRQQVEWQRQGRLLSMAVNISALQFRQSGFTDTVRRILDETGANPKYLELELTESALMQPTPEVLSRMQRLRELGIRLALDDFGTGYSSLSYLKRLPINRLKIDRSFVRDLPTDAEDVAIASATLSLARNLGMEVVAEGVENEAQREFLKNKGCPVMQGYLFSKPLPADELESWMASR